MALNPIAYTEHVVRSFLRYQLTAYPFADDWLHDQMRDLLSLDETRRSPLLKGPYVSLSRPFRQGAAVDALIRAGLLHPHLRERIPETLSHLYGHQERAVRAIAEGRTTLVSTGTGSGKTECFLYPIVSRCLGLRDDDAPPGISAVIVYPMNALAEDQLMRLRGLLAGTGIPFGMYVGKTPEHEADVAGVRLPAGSSRADYKARLERARREGSGETVYPAEEVCSREVMRSPARQPRILLTNVKQLELLLTRQQDVELFAGARLDFLVFDEAHMFTGALGAETACLIRRLRAFCRTDPARRTCIATSATIVDHDDPQAGRNFAARFFGVAGDAVTTVGEDYETEVWTERRFAPPAPGEDTAAILDHAVQAVEESTSTGTDVREVYRTLAGEELGTGDWPEVLYAALSRNELVFGLNEELATPRALEELPPALEGRVGRPVTEAEILAWLTLGAAARRDGRPLLRPVVHGFVRGIGGAVVSFPAAGDGPRLWLAAEDDRAADDGSERHAQFPVATCTVCGQHYYVAFLRDFTFTRRTPGGGDARAGGTCWEHQEKQLGGRRVVLVDTLIGADEEEETTAPHARTAPLHFCRGCGAAHPTAVSRCLACGRGGDTVRLLAIRQNEQRPGLLTSCLSCGSTGSTPNGGRYREPARPVRAINVADVHVLAQDMVHRAQRPRLLCFCDNRQDAAFQAGWMKDHARRFRLRALMAEGIRDNPQSIGDLVAHLDDRLESDEALSRALIPEVWEVARREHAGGRHAKERRKYLRFQVLREITLASRQALGLEPWGRMKVEYAGLDASLPWIQQRAHDLGISAEHLREGVASVLDYLRRRRALHDPEHELFTKYWKDGDPEVQQSAESSRARGNEAAPRVRRNACAGDPVVERGRPDHDAADREEVGGARGRHRAFPREPLCIPGGTRASGSGPAQGVQGTPAAERQRRTPGERRPSPALAQPRRVAVPELPPHHHSRAPAPPLHRLALRRHRRMGPGRRGQLRPATARRRLLDAAVRRAHRDGAGGRARAPGEPLQGRLGGGELPGVHADPGARHRHRQARLGADAQRAAAARQLPAVRRSRRSAPSHGGGPDLLPARLARPGLLRRAVEAARRPHRRARLQSAQRRDGRQARARDDHRGVARLRAGRRPAGGGTGRDPGRAAPLPAAAGGAVPLRGRRSPRRTV